MTISRHPSTESRFGKYPFNAELNLERFGGPLRQRQGPVRDIAVTRKEHLLVDLRLNGPSARLQLARTRAP